LLNEFTETIDELKTPPTQLVHLKKNKDLYNNVRAKLGTLHKRIDPIKMKFKYILDQDTEIGNVDLITDDDK
jgi:hypothetical protein